MKAPKRVDLLLDEVLQDDAVCLFRDSLRERCLQTLARRRRRRSVYACAGAAAAVVLILLTLSHWKASRPPALRRVAAARPSYHVSSTALGPTEHVRSAPGALMGWVVLTQAGTPTLSTPDVVDLQRLDTFEFLALFPNCPRGIVRDAHRRVAFVFFRDEDRRRYLAMGGP